MVVLANLMAGMDIQQAYAWLEGAERTPELGKQFHALEALCRFARPWPACGLCLAACTSLRDSC